ncbi:hypothetical protein BCEN4_440013 [Burkholderia cenocepacia]|nr:hypothetical protein BCEN4_440013 [Burkholderia cenocepacia]
MPGGVTGTPLAPDAGLSNHVMNMIMSLSYPVGRMVLSVQWCNA